MKTIVCLISLNFILSGLFAHAGNNHGFSESDLVLKNSTGDIYGTLTVPINPKISPLVLIIAGSGPTDRNCNSELTRLKTNAYKMLAEKLAENGISTLRFDKKGIGESKSTIKSENDLKIETYVNDVVGWITLLESDSRFSKIILLGHSEGSLIGMIASQQKNIAAFISVAGVGTPANEFMKKQYKPKLPPALYAQVESIIDSLRRGKRVNNIPTGQLYIPFRASVQPYLISWFKYDPTALINKLTCPALVVQGDKDLQVGIEEAQKLAQASHSGKLLMIHDMNHVLKTISGDMQENIASYSNPRLPVNEELVSRIVNFINPKE